MLFEEARPGWLDAHAATGLSSGEGLVARLAPPPAERDGPPPPAPDARLVVHEPEFGKVLRLFRREGNTLADILRAAWDGTSLALLTKTALHAVGDHHLVCVAACTPEELRALTRQTTVVADGGLNRWLFVATPGQAPRPYSSAVPAATLARCAARLDAICTWLDALPRDARLALDEPDATRQAWGAAFAAVQADRHYPVLARADTYLARLALAFAVADCSPVLRPEHIDAALALWTYCAQSALWATGGEAPNPLLARIVRILPPAGATRAWLREQLGNRISKAVLSEVLAEGVRGGLLRIARQPTGGRPVEWICATAQRLGLPAVRLARGRALRLDRHLMLAVRRAGNTTWTPAAVQAEPANAQTVRQRRLEAVAQLWRERRERTDAERQRWFELLRALEAAEQADDTAAAERALGELERLASGQPALLP
jgi:hypothetical protein